MQFYKLPIKELKRETPNAISLVFSIPEALQANYTFLAGQYVTLKLTLDGQEIRRAYSISTTPSSHEFRIAIKAVKNGFFSKFANENLNQGDLLEVSLPEGKFVFEPNKENQKSYLAFAAGSGITPISSIIKTMLSDEPNSTVVLVYGNKSPEETIFYNELHQLQEKYLGRFFIHYVFSQASAPDAFFGRIDKSVVNTVLNKHTDKTFSSYYLCGPEDMINLVSQILKEHSVSEKDIKFELFGTKPSADSGSSSAADGHTQISILVDHEEASFEMSQKQTVLEAALKQGLDVPYSCQGGICSSCICRVTEGSVTLKKNQILTDSEIADGLTLACQAVPTSSTLSIDFDNL
jgi:ring-1,2-phenylacetyl-CoA epoxidase subunit PaaE